MKEAYKLGSKLEADLVEGTNFVSYLPAYYIARKKHIPCTALYNDVCSLEVPRSKAEITVTSCFLANSLAT